MASIGILGAGNVARALAPAWTAAGHNVRSVRGTGCSLEPVPQVEIVPVEERNTERAFVTPNREPYELERREADLVYRYREHLHRLGHDVHRLRLLPPGETAPLYCDLWDVTTRTLIEAKATVSREHLRTAVGQLLDYGRFADAEQLTVLLPSRPRPDLLAYLASVSIAAVYPVGDGWEQA
jgi:hypothetical protein